MRIPDEVREAYRLWRPTPVYRARRLEKLLKTPAHIFYKYEGVSPPGSHKPNTAVAQAYYNAREGVERLTTETGAGQWGSSLAFAGMLFGLDVTVYMVRVSYDGKAPITSLMVREGLVEARSCNQVEAMDAARTFIEAEGLIPAPESAHAIKAVIDEADACRQTGEGRTILFLLSGHGLFDMKAYEDHLSGKMKPYEIPREKIAENLRSLRGLHPGFGP